MLERKAARYENRSVSVTSRWEPISQIYCNCGFRWGKLDLAVRSVLYISCGAKHDRDRNAAKNIERSGRHMSEGKGARRVVRLLRQQCLLNRSASRTKVSSYVSLSSWRILATSAQGACQLP